MRIPSLAVSAALSIALTGCDPGISVRGEALTGFVSVPYLDYTPRPRGQIDIHDVWFAFKDIPLDVQDCPRLAAERITFDGQVSEYDAGGRQGGFVRGWECSWVYMGFEYDADANEPRDGRLDIVDGDDTLTYVGENLVADRRLIPQDGLTATRGGELRFRYEPSSDLTSNHQAWLRANPEDDAFDLTATRFNGEIVVAFPDDTPTGQATLNFGFDLEINTVVCEGFSSCAITGEHYDQVVITVQ
jgi:hypothetical protein